MSPVERLAREISLFGSFAYFAVLVQSIVPSVRDLEQPRAGPVRAILSRRVLFLTSVAFLLVLKLLWRPIPVRIPSPWRDALALVGLASFVSGFALALWGRVALGEMVAVSTSLEAPLHKDHKLVTGGPYAFVRHPMYLGDGLIAFGLLAIWRNWASAFLLLSAPGLVLRAKREEEALSHKFGDKWEAYARRVPMLLPRPSLLIPRLERHKRPGHSSIV